MTRLSEHFTLDELAGSATAVRLGIDNTPPADILPHLIRAAQGMERIRARLERPILVHSGYRCEALERVLCERDFRSWCLRHERHVTSDSWAEYFRRKAHPQGWAVDFTSPAFGPPEQIVGVLRRSGIPMDQLIEEGGSSNGWVHVSFDPRLRGEVLTARFDRNGVPVYAPA